MFTWHSGGGTAGNTTYVESLRCNEQQHKTLQLKLPVNVSVVPRGKFGQLAPASLTIIDSTKNIASLFGEPQIAYAR
jgi:hypothetical protein